jgi:hypothetical protein
MKRFRTTPPCPNPFLRNTAVDDFARTFLL